MNHQGPETDQSKSLTLRILALRLPGEEDGASIGTWHWPQIEAEA